MQEGAGISIIIVSTSLVPNLGDDLVDYCGSGSAVDASDLCDDCADAVLNDDCDDGYVAGNDADDLVDDLAVDDGHGGSDRDEARGEALYEARCEELSEARCEELTGCYGSSKSHGALSSILFRSTSSGSSGSSLSSSSLSSSSGSSCTILVKNCVPGDDIRCLVITSKYVSSNDLTPSIS